jgi:hypothetical protein
LLEAELVPSASAERELDSSEPELPAQDEKLEAEVALEGVPGVVFLSHLGTYPGLLLEHRPVQRGERTRFQRQASAISSGLIFSQSG